MRREPKQAHPSGPLRIQLGCPKCGGPFVVDDETVALHCEHCASLLLLSAPERDEVYLAEGIVKSAQEVLEIVILYRVQAHRAEVVSRYQQTSDRPPDESYVQARLAEYERRLRGSARLLRADCLYAPYWHLTGTIVQGIVGRRGSGPKLVRLRAWGVEHTVPGYDEGVANLRDRGLRLSSTKVQPLTARQVAERRAFLPWIPVPERGYREVDKWRTRDIEHGLEPVVKHGLLLFARRLLVYRPYWLATVVADRGQESLLIDGGFGTIAGYTEPGEADALRRLATSDPLDSGSESFRRVHIVASRCPDCGFEQSLAAGQRIAVCRNCHRGLEPHPDGLRLAPWKHAARGAVRLDGDYAPFWRFTFRIAMAGAPAIEALEDYARALFPQGLPPGFAPKGRHLWVPAFRLLGTEPGDEAFQRLVEALHGDPPRVEDGKLPLGGQPAFWGASLPEPDARAVAPFVLLGLHGKASAARLTTLLVKKAVQDAKLTLGDAELVMVPFDRHGLELAPAGTRVVVPLLLLRGGAELDALRATVHREAASAD